jgi:peptide chain release factor 2
MDHLTGPLTTMKREIEGLMQQLSVEEKRSRLSELEMASGANEFWSDPEAAQKVMQELSRLKGQIEPWEKVNQRIGDALELAEMSDETLAEELQVEVDALQALVEKMSLQAMLSGPYDDEDAILAIHAGAGGTDSQDWAQMLERMYIRWAEQNGYKIDIIERSDGEEAGIKSVTMNVRGSYAYGYLRSEQGVHRLVRLSPFDSASRRHTSFAKVELWPDIQGEIDIEIKDTDLRMIPTGPAAQAASMSRRTIQRYG